MNDSIDLSSMDATAWVAALGAGDRRVLAKSITLVESTKPEDEAAAEKVLAALPSNTASIRIGLSGAPGVGKSTFIEALGLSLTARGHRLAVLAVDPTSRRTGGSILGDKTRMAGLARDPNAFIRPTPAGTHLGGVARHTRETIALVETAGFDIVFVETVGVGQSESMVADMTDMFLLLQSPGGGDDLQGIKRGIMELADMVIVTKADSDLLPAAHRAAADFQSALHLMRPKYADWLAPIFIVSALEGMGLEPVWTSVIAFIRLRRASGGFDRLRQDQRVRWFEAELRDRLIAGFSAHPSVAAALPALERALRENRISPAAAARELIRLYAQGA